MMSPSESAASQENLRTRLQVELRHGVEGLGVVLNRGVQVVTQLRPGQPLFGWRHASLQEVVELWTHAGLEHATLLSGRGIAAGEHCTGTAALQSSLIVTGAVHCVQAIH
jgi:hypothetical protein